MNAQHRSHLGPAVRAALGVLDRAAEGQDIPERDVHLALQVTGDAQCAFPRIRELARANRPAAAIHANTWHEGPASTHEIHPTAGGRP